ncbi:MAG: hypothetical protein KGD70_00010 [Candidatus Lokiarchaeota archaeon]|nr:hypothetical protein [Candidatus Lokiarchaeota archaeon]
MKKKIFRKRMKADEWNERVINSEEEKTKKVDDDWDEKNYEDKENGENENDFHEEDYEK